MACMQARCSRARRGPIPSVLRRQDAATVLIHGCGSSATSCGSVACVVVILSKAREAMRSVCTVSCLKERVRRTSLFAVRKGRGARDGWADRGRSCPTMPPSVRTSDKTSNQDRMATSMPTRGGEGGGGARRNQSIAKISVTRLRTRSDFRFSRFSRRAHFLAESHLSAGAIKFFSRVCGCNGSLPKLRTSASSSAVKMVRIRFRNDAGMMQGIR